MKLLTVSLAGWLTGTIAYVLIAGGPFNADSLVGLTIYGAFFSALPAVVTYWLILVPVFGVLWRRQAPRSVFVALGGLVFVYASPP